MASRAAEAEAINQDPWIVQVAQMGSHWVTHQRERGWSNEQLEEQMDRASSNLANPVENEDQLFVDRQLDWFAYTWFLAGLPRVVLGHRLAASFAATRVPEECAPIIEFPWPSFVIDVPFGILPAEDGFVTHIFTPSKVVDGAGCWQFWIASKNLEGTSVACTGIPVANARDLAKIAESLAFSRDELERVYCVALRIALGVAIELAEHRPSGVRAVGGVPLRRSRRDEPQCTMVRLTRDVKVDCRQHVRDYIAGASGKTLSVQHMVRGHWKMQTHGEKGSQRKFIHVEPYWRGPDDAPIALKNHVLTGETTRV